MQQSVKPDFATWTEFFVGGVPPLTSFGLDVLDLRTLVISTSEQQIGHARKVAELALIGITAQFEAFCKNQFAAVVNIHPALLQRFSASRSDTTIPLEDLLAVLDGITYRLGFLLSEKYDFGSARTVNNLYLDLMGVTPFSSDEIQAYDMFLSVRNMLVHHGGVYTIRNMRAQPAGHTTTGRVHLDSIIVGPEYFEESVRFFESMASKIAVSCHTALTDVLGKQKHRYRITLDRSNKCIDRTANRCAQHPRPVCGFLFGLSEFRFAEISKWSGWPT